MQISTTGARLNLDSGFALPEIFDIVIPHRSIDGRARVVWRDQGQAGIEFVVEKVPAIGSTEDYNAKIRKLEELNARFKAQIAELTTQVRRLTEEV